MGKLDMSYRTFDNLLPVEEWACSYCCRYEAYKKQGICEFGHKRKYRACGTTIPEPTESLNEGEGINLKGG